VKRVLEMFVLTTSCNCMCGKYYNYDNNYYQYYCRSYHHYYHYYYYYYYVTTSVQS